MGEPLMRIGEIAAFFNVSVKAIRLYEKKGILAPDYVDPATGYRYYSADKVKTLNALLELKALGFSLKEIRTILEGGADQRALMAAMKRKKIAWQNAVSAAENKVDAIDNIVARISESGEAKSLAELTEDERAWLLVKLVCVEEMRAESALTEAIWL